MTTIQGLRKDYNYNKILKDFKKEFCCNGTVVQDLELGQVLHKSSYDPFQLGILEDISGIVPHTSLLVF